MTPSFADINRDITLFRSNSNIILDVCYWISTGRVNQQVQS